MAIEFFDCPHCGKSLRVGARSCHHCHAVDENDWSDPDAAPEFADGGFSIDEYDEPLAAANWWRRVVVLVAMLLLLSFFLQAVLPLYRAVGE
ncbi:MAG: hypothetical protein KDA72_11610 [Planctomycetales bacterium]|nr:hypothetical protein [Planctomycetales bacterium]